jgi:uncharacterized membrane protein YbhN (UPF0104 family)
MALVDSADPHGRDGSATTSTDADGADDVAGERGARGGPNPPERDEDRSKRRRRILLVTFQIVVVAGVVVALTRRSGSLSQVGHLFTHMRWRWFVAALAAEAGAMLCLGALQRQLMRTASVPVSLGRMTTITLASNAVAQSVPAGGLLAEGYVYRRYRGLGARPMVSAWVELSSGALAAAALAAVVLAGALLTGGSLGQSLAPIAGIVFVGACVAAALFRRTHALATLLRGFLRVAARFLPAKIERGLRTGAERLDDMDEMHPSVGSWAVAGAFAGGNWLCDCLCMAWAMKAVDVPVPWRSVLLAFAAAQLLAMFPITPGGLGVVEGGLAVVLTRLGEPASAATAGTLAFRAVSFWALVVVGWLAVGGLLLAERRSGRARAEPSAPASVDVPI